MFILIASVVLVLFTLFVLFENAKFNEACDKGDLDFVKTKLNKLNCISVNNVSMEKAIKSGNIELVKYLIKYVDLKESEYLNTACQYHHDAIVNLLIEKGATIGIFNYFIARFLQPVFNKDLLVLYISKYGYLTEEIILNIAKNKEFDLIKLIIEKESYQLNNCLIIACEYGQIDLFTYLVENCTISDDDFEDALYIAIRNYQVDIVKEFIEKEIKINKEPDSHISKIIEMAKILS